MKIEAHDPEEMPGRIGKRITSLLAAWWYPVISWWFLGAGHLYERIPMGRVKNSFPRATSSIARPEGIQTLVRFEVYAADIGGKVLPNGAEPCLDLGQQTT
jgi:hypothetical protein